MRHEDAGSGATTLPAPTALRAREADLVFDFSGKSVPDLGGLTLLLTARMLADREDRKVWVRALPDRTWQLLHALGLDHMFEFFPNSARRVN